MKKKCCMIDAITKILVLIGALNWGLVGFFNFNLVTAIFGEMNLISRIVYMVVGLSALWLIACKLFCKKSCSTHCSSDPKS